MGDCVGGNSLMNVGLDTIFYVGRLIWAGFLTLRWIDGQITHFRPARPEEKNRYAISDPLKIMHYLLILLHGNHLHMCAHRCAKRFVII